jgi:hypothetical protein
MAQQTYSANLSAATFPMLFRDATRSIIIKGPDQTFAPVIDSKSDQDRNASIPQMLYCHNVLPTSYGYSSITFKKVIEFPGSLQGSFDDLKLIRSSTGAKAYITLTDQGKLYITQPPLYRWIYVTGSSTYIGKKLTVAYVDGKSYIYIATVGCFLYDFSTNTLLPQSLTGLTLADIQGVVASSGYLLCWSNTALYWSSSIDVTDFTPSLLTGAGGGNVQSAEGNITFCKPALQGILVHTLSNVIYFNYTANSRFPFSANAPVVGAGGCALDRYTAADSSSASYYMYGTSGLQLLNTRLAQNVYPEVTDFISGFYFEDFDYATNEFTFRALQVQLLRSLTLVASRYLVVSYGITELTHAIVIDLIQKRFGKIKFTHTICFEFEDLSSPVSNSTTDSIALLSPTGDVYTVKLADITTECDSVAIFGKYQYVRSRVLQLHSIEVENVQYESNFQLGLLSAIDGKNYSTQILTNITHSGLLYKANMRVTALNFAVLFKGNFNANSLLLVYSIGGSR